MTRIRCKPNQVEQVIQFCVNNEIPYYNNSKTDFVFISMKDVHEISVFLDRLDSLEKQELVKKEILKSNLF